jgi:hypothetical protein
MIAQYLNNEGFHTSKMTLQDEAKVKAVELEDQQVELKRLKKAILGTSHDSNPKELHFLHFFCF